MTTLREAAEEFLAQPRLGVAGVSRDSGQPANLIYRRLREHGHTVFAINPSADSVEGDPAYATVGDVPGELDGVVVVTTPEVSDTVVADCVRAGVPRVWLHRGIGPGSVSERAIALCRESDTKLIRGGCPNMFGATSDAGHRCMRAMLAFGRRIPSELPDGDYPLDPTSGASGSRGAGAPNLL
jgi:predicted CoA-binding protein